MSTPLERFIRDNREDFDQDQPDPLIWKKLQKELNVVKPKGKLFSLSYLRWSAAASVLLVVGVLAVYLNGPSGTNQHTNLEIKPGAAQDLISGINPNYAKEVYHFTQLIALKQNELKQIQKDEPELYNTFISEITLLDSSYNALQKQLPVNPNREQLLEAMIQNLRLQTELLNQQLMIIQKIKQLKNSNDDENSESI